jgi:chromosomal replication initiation ATPase DnaA
VSSGSRERRIAEPRSVVALIVRDADHLSLMALSRKLKRDLSGLSQSASRLEIKLGKDKVLEKKINKIKDLIG